MIRTEKRYTSGDIVKKEIPLKNSSYNFTIPQYAKVMWIEELAGFYLVNKNGKILWELGGDKYNIEVVGNERENSDLLGE